MFFIEISRSLMCLSPCLFLLLGAANPSMAQEHDTPAHEHKATQIAGVDNTKMGAYRALAQLSFEAFQRGDNATAAELARILERTWDGAEESGGERSLVKINKDLFEQIDKAMDAFIKPLLRYASQAPNPTAVQVAYDDYLIKLKQGN